MVENKEMLYRQCFSNLLWKMYYDGPGKPDAIEIEWDSSAPYTDVSLLEDNILVNTTNKTTESSNRSK
jgi:hypothetical protein